MRILALELGSWSVKGVEFESGFRRFEILDLHEVRLPLRLSDPVELYKQAITDLFAKLPSNPDKVVLSLPASNISLRFLTIPVKQRKKAEQMYRFELEDSLPFKLDDTVVEHVIYSQKDSSLVFAAIAPNRFIIQHLDYLKKIGLDPDWLTFEGMGLINLYLGSLIKTPSEISGPTLLLDMGHTKTNLSIVNDSRVEVFRSFSWGGFAITQNIALTTGLPLEDSEFQKHQMVLGGTPNEKTNLELSTTTLQAIGPLLTEINHSLIAYRNATKQSITSIQLSGGTALLKGLSQIIGKQLGGLPCDIFDPSRTFSLKESLRANLEAPRFGEAWGRGNVFGRKSPLVFNFRKKFFGKHSSLGEISAFISNPNVLKLGRYGATLIFILFVHVTAASYFAEQESVKANEELKKVFQDTFKSAPKALKTALTSNPQELKKYIETKNKEMEEKLKMVSKGKESMISNVKKITDSFPGTVRVDVNKLEINDRNLTMEGVLYEGDITSVTENLKKIPLLSEVSITLDGQRFTYRAKVSGR